MFFIKIKLAVLRRKARFLRSTADYFDNLFSLTTYRIGNLTKEVYGRKDVRFSRLFDLLKPNDLETVTLTDEEKVEARGLLEALEKDPYVRFNRSSRTVAETLGRMFAAASMDHNPGKLFGEFLRNLQPNDDDNKDTTDPDTGPYL